MNIEEEKKLRELPEVKQFFYLEDQIKKLKEEVEKLKEEKVEREPYRWLQHRVGQLQRRLDKYNLK